jgi:hypothetical protein
MTFKGIVFGVGVAVLDDCGHSQLLGLEEFQLDDTEKENTSQKQLMQAEHPSSTATTSSFRLPQSSATSKAAADKSSH